MIGIKEKSFIVTGATSGIGRATALALADAGAHVVLSARSKVHLDALVAEISAAGGRAVAVVGDVTEEETSARLVETATAEFGGLDGAFNNAGTSGQLAPIAQFTLADWRQTLDTNLTSVFLGIKYQAPALASRGGGAIVCSSSAVGVSVGLMGNSAYTAAKAAIVGLVKTAAVELAPDNIRVNAIAPAAVDTPANMVNFPESGPEVRAFVESVHAMKRIARPQEIAAPVVFLLSQSSSFITGSTLLVDGGMTISL